MSFDLSQLDFPNRYWPHDHDDKFHHNFIEDVEEFNHESGLFTHLPHADAKCNKETNQTCDRKIINVSYFEYNCGPMRWPHTGNSYSEMNIFTFTAKNIWFVHV